MFSITKNIFKIKIILVFTHGIVNYKLYQNHAQACLYLVHALIIVKLITTSPTSTTLFNMQLNAKKGLKVKIISKTNRL